MGTLLRLCFLVNLNIYSISILVLIINIYGSQLTNGEEVVLETINGPVKGLQTAKSRAFLGVPYARPPIGEYRWTDPVTYGSWKDNGPLDATKVKAGCYQVNCTEGNPYLACPTTISEDCLHLYIWTPHDATPTSDLPVMVFIHGGSFHQVSGGATVFNGEDLVHANNVILVNMNYRLGAFGFMYTGSSSDDITGNYGIKDQRLALQWVQKNIRSFGGDPTKVTVFGQSAGAQSIAIHMTNRKSEGLFRAAILESDPFSIRFKNEQQAIGFGDVITDLLKCAKGDISCLRSKTAFEIGEAQAEARSKYVSGGVLEMFEPIGPVIEGNEVTAEPMEAAKAGLFMDVPLILGTLSEEARNYVYSVWDSPMNMIIYMGLLELVMPENSADIFQKYPPSLIDCRQTLQQLTTDVVFTCSARNVSNTLLLQSNRTSGVYLYEFDHALSFPGWKNFTYCTNHVCHGTELPILFHTPRLGGFSMSADEERLSTEMQSYWTNFAYNLNPSSGPRPVQLTWPAFQSAPESIMKLQSPENKLLSDYRGSYCRFWDRVGYYSHNWGDLSGITSLVGLT